MTLEDDVDFEFKKYNQSKPPLRWIANLFGSIGSYYILRAHIADEKKQFKKTKLYCFIFDCTFKIYNKWGTYYKIKDREEEF
jgi:hypothetical protein